MSQNYGTCPIGFFPKKPNHSQQQFLVRTKNINHWELLRKQHRVMRITFQHFWSPPQQKKKKQPPPPVFFPNVDGEIFPSKPVSRGTNKDWICATGSAKISALTSSSPHFFFFRLNDFGGGREQNSKKKTGFCPKNPDPSRNFVGLMVKIPSPE